MQMGSMVLDYRKHKADVEKLLGKGSAMDAKTLTECFRHDRVDIP